MPFRFDSTVEKIEAGVCRWVPKVWPVIWPPKAHFEGSGSELMPGVNLAWASMSGEATGGRQ